MLPDLPQLILNLRPDLRDRMGFGLPHKRMHYLAWLATSGNSEYRALAEDAGFHRLLSTPAPDGASTMLQYLVWLARPDVQQALPLKTARAAYLRWFYTHGLAEHGYWHWLSEAERQHALTLAGAVAQQQQPPQPAPSSALPSASGAMPFGVNLVGYAFGQLGIGEDARMAARALLAADVPMTMLNFAPGADVPQNDRSMAAQVGTDGRYAFNLFCMTAEEHGRYYAEHGSAQWRGRYTIGYWPWELGAWPAQWRMLLGLVDEVWVSSRHTYDALAPVCDRPLQLMPMAVDVGELPAALDHVQRDAARAATRQRHALPAQATLFCFAFDLKSSVARKNPQACVNAFLQAFPPEQYPPQRVGLVIKVHPPTGRNRAWEQLRRLAAQDARIHLVVATLPRPDLLALYQACDCFVSLHRAEGFGRGLAEALQLGLHLITTGYSGNVDFCAGPQVDLVRYRLVKLRPGQYPHGEGQQWAEPDVAHAAELMRRFVDHGQHAAPRAWPQFSLPVIGQAYRQRLLEISPA